LPSRRKHLRASDGQEPAEHAQVHEPEHVRLEALFEAFNLLNHVNGVALNGTFGTGTYPANPLPSFKQMTAVADPRTVQLGLRVSF